MSSIILNEQQEQICSKIVNDVKNGRLINEFDGEPGTGKSVVLMECFRRLNYSPSEILPMAYTGQAAIVMRTKGFYNARSAHSSIYNLEKINKKNNGSIIMDTHYNIPEEGIVFSPKTHLGGIKAIAIDEGYQIPLGMKADIEKFNLPIIVTGDRHQLPPVKAKPAYLTGDDIPHLSQLMRQHENDPIIYLSRRAKNNLPIHTGMYGSNVLVISEEDVTDLMLQKSNIILCGTNKSREELNRYIRSNIYNIKSNLPVFGDRMICRKNNWDIELEGISLANGLVGTVTNSPSVLNFNGKKYDIDFKPDLMPRSFRNIHCDYEYLTSSPENKQYAKSNKYNNNEKFEYAYALTVHLSQGAEFNGGMYFEDAMGGGIKNQIDYTAITRFKQFLIYVKRKRRYY